MFADFLSQLLQRDTLLAVGLSLFMIGLVLRNFARNNRRTIALRKQHALDLRKRGESNRADEVDAATERWDKYLPRYANGLTIAGVIIALAAVFR